MKTSLKINDRAFSNLLRAQFGQPGGSPSACAEFDPDLANAYVEHSLTPVIQTRYERHLSECSGCRTSVVALARMAQADSIPLQAAERTILGSGEPGWLGSIKAGFSALASPRWAAAAALVIIAVAIPALMWQSGRFGGSNDAALEESLSAQKRAAEPAAPPDSQVDKYPSDPAGDTKMKDSERAPSVAKASPAKETASAYDDRASTSSVATKETNESNSQPVSQPAAETPERKTDAGTLAAATQDESRARARTERPAGGAAAPAPASREGAEESTVLSKIDKDRALKLPAEDRDSVSVKLRPGAADSGGPKTERERADASITPRDGEAPKTKEAESPVARGTFARRGGTSALLERDSARADRANSPQKKVGKKTFLLSKGIWIDKDYEPTKDMPIVTVVRASDVYRDMLEKKNKLSSFLTSFAEGDRAIIVYKSTVYKLIPHPDNK